MLNPEYGGDGVKTSGENAQGPVAGIPPVIWGQMVCCFYTGNMFPEKYKHGAFIAFHGSWNRSPEPQKGYFIALFRLKMEISGDWEVFADNWAGNSYTAQQSKTSPVQTRAKP